jgi:hypothetical protein
VPKIQVVAVAGVTLDGDVSFARVSINKDKAGIGTRGDGGGLRDVGVLEDAFDDDGGVDGPDMRGYSRERVN